MSDDDDRISKLQKENEELRARVSALEKPKQGTVEFKPGEWRGPIDWTANFTLPRSAIEAMVRAAPDSLVRSVVADNYARGAPAEKPAEARVVPSERGWRAETPLGLPPGQATIERMLDVDDALWRAERAKQFAGLVKKEDKA
jgi:hypothetical protein